MDIKQFVKERDEALLSMDENKIRAHFLKWNKKELPKDLEVFWMTIHKARTGATSLPMAERQKSKQWLSEKGLHSLDDGDIP